MVKIIKMEVAEYENDLKQRQELGVCDALNQVRMFLISKKAPADFFGPESLDPRFMKCKLMIDILNEIGVDPVEVQKVTKNIVPESTETASPEPATEQPKADCCGSESSCTDAALPDQPIAQ